MYHWNRNFTNLISLKRTFCPGAVASLKLCITVFSSFGISSPHHVCSGMSGLAVEYVGA